MWQSLQKRLTFPYYTSLFHTHVAKPAETFWRQIRSGRIGSQTSLTLSNLAVATLSNRVAVPFKTNMFQPCFDRVV